MTTEQWFKLLPEPYKTQALKNMFANHECHDMAHAIMSGIGWLHTPEGWSYWSRLYRLYDRLNEYV